MYVFRTKASGDWLKAEAPQTYHGIYTLPLNGSDELSHAVANGAQHD